MYLSDETTGREASDQANEVVLKLSTSAQDHKVQAC